ncbi:hypothetical protein AB1N83_009516 [Pleurotus pulmonarius]
MTSPSSRRKHFTGSRYGDKEDRPYASNSPAIAPPDELDRNDQRAYKPHLVHCSLITPRMSQFIDYRRSKADDHKHARLGNLTNPLHLLDRHSIVTASYEPTKRPLDDRQTPPAPHAKIYSFFTAGFLVYTESASLFPYFRLDPSTSSDSPLRTQL